MSSLIGITMGCPVGIGPEIIIRFHEDLDEDPEFLPVVIGDIGVLSRCAGELGSAIPIFPWQSGQLVRRNGVNVLPLSDLSGSLRWGVPSRQTGLAMGRYIEEAVRLIGAGELAGMVTCPITKSSLYEAGYHFPGHTEMLASLCGIENFAMMMAGDRLRVTLVTIHMGLAEVAASLSLNAVLRMIEMTGTSLIRDFGITSPRLAVAGLNPHAGEGGMFGREEQEIIIPAITEAVAKGWQVSGPFPPDTVFNRTLGGAFDAVVCMYHDQGLIPFKLVHFEDGVNVTLGLPLVRTSVDHGTAYDIAGQGKASAQSLKSAFSLAGNIAKNRVGFAEEREID
ncbi:MAG: 4-hydroxythreonine-4-phosphate dehydrogenase PdxA [Proteobacteria bacterium]|nr:4-hydroxythreonine-4-phosphate dehydrogenase PdxA [Pseudomonadota bacterium]MBU1687278.1 4-hydroxythreonine-4-phosphate dehydrogenase PdxA [Pseudomonadota bacterium]